MIQSHNDWDPLEEVVVGIATHARLPDINKSTHSFCYAGETAEDISSLQGPHATQIIEEANEDLDNLSDTLSSLGVKVTRPTAIDHSKPFSTPEWSSSGWYTYCPRDLLLPLDNMVIECPSPMRARYFETRAYYDILYDAMRDGSKWISAPKPILTDDNYQLDNLEDPTLLNKEIIFDAPNVVRLGKDLLFQVSNSGNKLGYEWLKSIVGDKYNIHLAEKYYSFSHFDSTVLPLRPGLVLFNGDRCSKDHYPPIFKDWEKIFFPGDKVVDVGSNLINGISPCSKYIGLNFLSVTPELVICDINQEELRRTLSKFGIDSIGLPMRQARTLSGGFHCVTLDTKRKGSLESYF
jgi:N-dimethylarginine dimethylaminohydrolase